MHPLTVMWAPHIWREVGWENLQRLIHVGGFDNILNTPNGIVHRLLTRLAFLHMLHPFQPFVFGQKNLGPRMSVALGVPLVMYGESNIEYGDPLEDGDDDTMQEAYYSSSRDLNQIFLGGLPAAQILIDCGLHPNDLECYLPVDPEKLARTRTRVHYLGHYIPWDPQECYYFAVEKTGLQAAAERSEGTYSKYTELDDKLPPLNFYTMHVKYGVGRAMYDASQEIRNGKITREEGVALVKKFDGEYPKMYLNEILEYLGMDKEEFDRICDSYRSEHLWMRENGRWTLRYPCE
jgi:N-acetyl sugar amidotransferase